MPEARPDSRTPSTAPLTLIAAAFELPAPVASVSPLGNGIINDTYLVTLTAAPERFVLQRVNTEVFQHPALVMANIEALARHVQARQTADPTAAPWIVPELVPARSAPQPWVEVEGQTWRLLTYIDNTRCFDTVTSPAQAREVGRAIGTFHALISDLPVSALADTLEGFHITPGYLAQFDAVLAAGSPPTEAPTLEALRFVEERRGSVAVLEEAKAAGHLVERPIHGDPKVNNVLMDRGGTQAVALIDLDTVKPGLVHYDIGDALRSGCNPLGEEPPDLTAVSFDLDLARAMLEGYLGAARAFLTPADLEHLFAAIRLLPLELGLRFLTDHLAGDHYFKTSYPGQNLHRALVQFQLTRSIEDQEQGIRAIIQALT